MNTVFSCNRCGAFFMPSASMSALCQTCTQNEAQRPLSYEERASNCLYPSAHPSLECSFHPHTKDHVGMKMVLNGTETVVQIFLTPEEIERLCDLARRASIKTLVRG